MTRRLATTLTALAAVAAGCGGGPPGDLFVVERSGTVPGARLTLRVTDDGGAYCNRLGRREITSEQLLDARELRRQLTGEEGRGPADRGMRLPPAPGSILRYEVRTEDGSVAFSDNSQGQPQAFFELAKLVRDVARGACGLPR